MRKVVIPKIKYTYLITVGNDHEMSPWGMPKKYVPAGILLIKPFEYKIQARSLKTATTTTTTWCDGKHYAVDGQNMDTYLFFADITSGIFPNVDMKLFDTLHQN